MKPLVIYHGNCADGFGAAWVLWKYFKGKADFYAGVYQRPPPNVEDRFVILVDFSYKRDVLVKMVQGARAILVLDHHKTAAKDLEPDPIEDVFAVSKGASWAEFSAELAEWTPAEKGIYALFDMERSGAGIAWDFFNPGKLRPQLINVIEDRDLWRFALGEDYTRRIQAALFSYPYEFELWDKLITEAPMLAQLEKDGIAIERKHHKDISELIEVVTRPMRFLTPDNGSIVVPAANLPYTLTSDAGHLLCERTLYGEKHDAPGSRWPFAACYWDKPDGRQFSLRSQEDGTDVSEIAKLYGGGGHSRASGFTVPYHRLPEFEP